MSRLLRLPPVRAVASAVHFFAGRLLDASDLEAEQRYAEGRVEVDAGEGFERWRRVDDLSGAGSGDRVFAVDSATGSLRFGDGRNGLRPPAGARIRATYRRGARDDD